MTCFTKMALSFPLKKTRSIRKNKTLSNSKSINGSGPFLFSNAKFKLESLSIPIAVSAINRPKNRITYLVVLPIERTVFLSSIYFPKILLISKDLTRLPIRLINIKKTIGRTTSLIVNSSPKRVMGSLISGMFLLM